MHHTSNIYILGHRGMASSAIKRILEARSYHNIIIRIPSKLDNTNPEALNLFLETERPEYVFLAAAKVCSILANSIYSEKTLYLKIIFGFTGLMSRLNLMMPIARILDLSKINESYIVIQKS